MNDNIKVSTPSMTNSLTENRIIAPIILGIAILLGIIVTRPLYLSYIEDKDRETKATTQYENLSLEHEKLLAIKNNASGSINENDKQKIDKLGRAFNRSDIMSAIMLSEHTKDTIDHPASISIASVNLSDPTKLPNGLSLAKVGINLRGKTIDAIIDYITYLTSETQYAFTIEDISLPIDTAPEGDIPTGYALAVSLGIYSYE